MSAVAKKHIEEYDPKRVILDKLGDLSRFEIANNEVLLAIYQRPDVTPGGIALPDRVLKEDVYQGKVGLVVKIGSACRFERLDPQTGIQYGLNIQLHDWVVVRPSDTWALDVNGDPKVLARADFVPCRLVFDDHIRARIDNPLMIW